MAKEKDQDKALAEKEAALAQMQDDIDKRTKDLEEREAALEARSKELGEWEKHLDSRQAEIQSLMPGDPSPELTEHQEALIAEACKAYGIAPEFVFRSGIDRQTVQAVIVTKGGAKVKYFRGDEVKPLRQIAITGINPELEKRRAIVGRPRAKK
jgi:hypothetical protein